MNERGQISTLDLVVASAVFLSILFSAVYLWGDTMKSIGRTSEKNDLDSKVLDISETLVKTQGEPPDWQNMAAGDINSSSVKSLGLASEDNILDPEKIDKLKLIDYDEAREMMGLSREGYNITITNSSGEVTHSIGRPVFGQSGGTERIVLVSGVKSIINIKLFKQGGLGI